MQQRLKDLRNEFDLTQSELGDILNMSQTGYSKYETGSNDIPTRVLKSLSKFYKTSVDYILGLTDEKEQYPASRSSEGYEKSLSTQNSQISHKGKQAKQGK